MLNFIKDKKWIIASLIIIYLGIFFICKGNLYTQDEYNYSHISWTSEKLSSFSDIGKSLSLIYNQWSGRIPVLGLVQVFLYLGRILYEILNPLVFVLFIIMILKISNKQVTSKGIFIVLLLTLFGVYKFWEKYIWLSGSLNYLWTVMLMLIVMYYIYSIVVENKKINLINTIVLFIVSFFAGWSHENTAFVLGSFIIFICIFNFKKILQFDNKTKVKLITSIILFGIGAILLIFCPGNFARMSGTKKGISILPILKNVLAMYKIIILYVFTIIILKKSKKINEYTNVKQVISLQLKYFIFPMLFALTPMIIISEFPIRAGLAYEVMLFIVIMQNLERIYNEYENKNLVKRTTTAVIIISIILLYSRAYFSINYLLPYGEKMEAQIKAAKINGKNDVTISAFDKLNLANLINGYMDIFPKNTDISIINTYMSTYYNVDTITAVKDGFVQIEICIEDEESIESYNVLDKTTNEIISKRIIDVRFPMPNMELKNRLLFEIPIDKLNNAYIDIPDEIKEKIVDVKLKSIEEIDAFDVYSIVK